MLRARVRNGQVEAFGSEGSGRVTGLAWSDGLVDLDDSAQQIEPGTPVRFNSLTPASACNACRA